jgi:dual specificity phosphatase 12
VQAHDSAANDLKQHFQKAYEFIETQRNLNRNVLVHCYVGVSRSATIVIAYLMQKFGWSMQQAYQ